MILRQLFKPNNIYIYQNEKKIDEKEKIVIV